jgi:hypothetical protein
MEPQVKSVKETIHYLIQSWHTAEDLAEAVLVAPVAEPILAHLME